jgi:transposase
MRDSLTRRTATEQPVRSYIGCDAHRRYSVFVSVDENGRASQPTRVEHAGNALAEYLASLPAEVDIAVEASGSWYWLIDAIEEAGKTPHLAQAFAARRMLGGGHKTDKIDARALATLLRNGTLPEVWVPEARLRDVRSLVRSRLNLRRQQTDFKNRVVAAVNRYGLREANDDQDLFHGKGRVRLSVYIGRLPDHTREATTREWQIIDELEQHIEELDERIRERVGRLGWSRLLKTLPGVGEILGATIFLEIGKASRFPSPQHLASYAGLVPTVHASGGKTFHGPTTPKSNHYLRWAFVEAANVIATRQKQKAWAERHVMRQYLKLRASKGHQKAAVAVARHLAESAWWILTKAQPYREPQPVVAQVSSSKNG